MIENINPMVSILDYTGAAIQDQITGFRYKFSEEEDDVCEFKIKSDDPKLADRPEFQEGKQLTVQWGYRNSDVSKTRRVFIFDTAREYMEDGVFLSITCHEKFALAKMDSVSNKNLRQLKKNTPIIFSPEVLSSMSLEVEKGNSELQKLLADQKINLKGVTGGDIDNPNKVVSYYNGNSSTFQGLRNFLDKLDGGPYVIDSRDDYVIIRTRDFSQKSSYTYSYGNNGNQILYFKAETQSRSKGSQSKKVKVTSWDRENKSAVTHEIDGSQDKGTVLAKSNPMQWADIKDSKIQGTFPDFKKPQSQLSKLGIKKGDRAVNTDKGFREDYDGKSFERGTIGPDGQSIKRFYKGTDYGSRPKDGLYAARDNTATVRRNYEIITDDPLPSKNMISNEEPQRAKAHADNRRKDEELKSNPASAKVVGNPYLECGKLITFLGCSVKDAGNYYIKEVEHTIDDGGYITTIPKLVRQGVNKKTSKVVTVSQSGKDARKVNTSKGETGTTQSTTVKIKSKKAS